MFPFPVAFDFFGKVPIQGKVIPEKLLSVRTDPSTAFVWICNDEAHFEKIVQRGSKYWISRFLITPVDLSIYCFQLFN